MRFGQIQASLICLSPFTIFVKTFQIRMTQSSRHRRRSYHSERARSRERTRTESHSHAGNGNGNGGAPQPTPFFGDKTDKNDGWNRYKEAQLARMPERLNADPLQRVISVFVEGYEDVAFWRGIFDNYETERLKFEINVPPRKDLAKGKKVILSMLPDSSPSKLLCVDSDFDYLFGQSTEQSRLINNSKYLFHTYAYATENFLCYAPSLHNVCVKATKNDAYIFDFEQFMAEYSKIVYPLFIWYAYSAWLKTENIFTLLEFRSSVKLNYLEVENNGRDTLQWLEKQVHKRLEILRKRHAGWDDDISIFERKLTEQGLSPELTYLYMQGHTLMDNVVVIMLNAVCEQLRLMSNIRITTSTKTGMALKNELSNYNNALRGVRDVLLDNEAYKECPLYKKLQQDIESFLSTL